MTPDDLRTLPKALLHDHLDGGLRIETVLDLADEVGYEELPGDDPETLRRWFHQGESGSLERYLGAFRHTVAVMQSEAALERVAYEAVVDNAAESVVYGEFRFGPSLHTRNGLTREAAIEAVLSGLARGSRETGMVTGAIIDALRDQDDSESVARAATRYVGRGVVAFDLSGPEAGFVADDHLAACRYAVESGLPLTIHAGEGDGPNSIWRATARCGARRIGHGVRIIEDTEVVDGEITRLGALARTVRDLQIPLEVAITSNLHTAAFPSPGLHPFGMLYRSGFAVTLNTDNRLMSGITITDEFALAAATYSLTVSDLEQITITSLLAAFGDWQERKRLIDEVVRPAYASV